MGAGWKTTRLLWYVVGATAFLAVVSALVAQLDSPLSGTVTATIFEQDAAPYAVMVSIPDLELSKPLYNTDQQARVLAAIPNPQGDRAAFMLSAAGKRTINIGDLAGTDVAEVTQGVVDTPSWTADGSSVLFSSYTAETGGESGLNNWTVYRANGQGESQVVGVGYYPFGAANQRAFALTEAGIALFNFNDPNPTMAVLSPVSVPVTTPFTASPDGKRVAWVAPADKSLQVFENQGGIFVPILVTSAVRPQSLVFSPHGDYLIGTTHTETNTTFMLVKVMGGELRELGELPGYVRVHSWWYE